MKKSKVPNQLYRDLMGVNGLNAFDGYDSSSRKQMFSSHIGQTLVVNGSTERLIQTGMEREYAKYTFSIKMPCNARIIRVIDRYRKKIGEDSIEINPQTVVIYEDADSGEIGMLSIPRYCSYHQYFGFAYKSQPALSELRPNAFIAKDTILMDSPSVTTDGGYKYGVEMNMAFMSHPAASEDGILISRDVLPRFAFKTFETRVVEWGSKRFPLNLYGDDNTFKPFPDIGERIRSDGLLMCLRSYEKDLAVVEQNVAALREPDFTFDKCTYAAGPGGVIVDIRVQHDAHNQPADIHFEMDAQPLKYDKARRQFYQEILSEYQKLKREKGESLRITPELHRMLVEAMAVMENETQRIIKLYRQAPLDDWRVEFVIQYDITPTVGFKLTDCHGGKGVVCHIAEPEQMPVDEAGNRADIVMDPNSTISRMNLGRLYEQYINAASRDVAKRIRELLAVKPEDHKPVIAISALEAKNDERFEKAWQYLMGYYAIVSPKMYVWFTTGQYKEPRSKHLAHVVKEGLYLYYPPDNDPEGEQIVSQLEKNYRPTFGPVRYVGYSGKPVVTKNPVRIGSIYMILLEKIGDDWTAVSSGKTQHFGVLSQVTNTDKFATPTRQQAIRAWGEAEVRIAVSYVGPRFVADMLDRNNNSSTHKDILHSILHAEKPTNIYTAVDRAKIPLGGAKPLQLVKHIAECGGWKFDYSRHIPSWELPQISQVVPPVEKGKQAQKA
jgi:DNA-directed RNA polymerase beta subunit